VAGIGAIGLRALLAATQRTGLRRLGQVHLCADRFELLDDEAPVVASSATLRSWPAKRLRNWRTPSRCPGDTRARLTSPVSVSSQSAVICARCRSSPDTIAIWGLLTLHGSLPARYARLS
jgi:hypothetical protein